jgi:hypothetical protein
MASGRSAAAANQVDDDHHQRYKQQQVNQASGHVQAESQQPQNQKYSDNRPKHVNLLVYPCCRFILVALLPGCASSGSRETALSDFPHSRQTLLARGVISPQNGHILCDRTSWVCGLSVASKARKKSRNEASCRRKEGRYGSISI